MRNKIMEKIKKEREKGIVTFNLEEATGPTEPAFQYFTTGPLHLQDDTKFWLVMFENYADDTQIVMGNFAGFDYDGPIEVHPAVLFQISPRNVGSAVYRIRDIDENIGGIEMRIGFNPNHVVANILALDDTGEHIIPGNTIIHKQLIRIFPMP
ncbi:hypothetical protein HYH96_00430 [Clostridium botulinum]|uniref:hypothetical protein n=1 Tax=Clostridium botulinum TaxID=1491 RepID=UPI00174AE70E|nr:hypothetical protein [Clostridium botulinum]